MQCVYGFAVQFEIAFTLVGSVEPEVKEFFLCPCAFIYCGSTSFRISGAVCWARSSMQTNSSFVVRQSP